MIHSPRQLNDLVFFETWLSALTVVIVNAGTDICCTNVTILTFVVQRLLYFDQRKIYFAFVSVNNILNMEHLT